MVKAVADIEIYGYTDKTQYMPGEKGTLKIWIYNEGTEDIILNNVTIEYPWHSYYIWEGNETITVNTAILIGKNWTTTISFTIPTDGRAVGGNIRVTAVTDKVPSRFRNFSLAVANAPIYASLQDIDKIVTLFTVLVVLLIVCTVIIAATMFLTSRKPKVTWKEEKPE
jgi:uncharacterized membrane protein